MSDRPRGDLRLLYKPTPSASIFKVVILLALLRHKRLSADETLSVEDRISPVPIGIQQATYRSSNQAFLTLSSRLGAGLLQREAEQMQFFVPNTVFPNDFGRLPTIYRGADLPTDPMHIHRFMAAVAEGAGLPKADAVQLHTFLLWPGSCQMQRGGKRLTGLLHAKSGTYAGAAYMTGFCMADGDADADVVTVFVPYAPPAWRPAREKAIRLFYAAFNVRAPEDVFR